MYICQWLLHSNRHENVASSPGHQSGSRSPGWRPHFFAGNSGETERIEFVDFTTRADGRFSIRETLSSDLCSCFLDLASVHRRAPNTIMGRAIAAYAMDPVRLSIVGSRLPDDLSHRGNAHYRGIRVASYAFRFFAPPWRALKRRLALQTTYRRPRRRTTWQSR